MNRMSEDPNKPSDPTSTTEKEGQAAEQGSKPTGSVSAHQPTQAPTAETQKPQTPVKAEPQRAMPLGIAKAAETNQLNVPNPHPSRDAGPFSAGHKYNEVAQYDNFFNFPMDTAYNVIDAINYFSDEKNRNRYTYDQQQLVISRIVRAAAEFGIDIEGISNRLKV